MQAVKNKQPKILFEVVLSMKQLITRNGTQLHDPEWEIIIEILTTIVHQIGMSIILLLFYSLTCTLKSKVQKKLIKIKKSNLVYKISEMTTYHFFSQTFTYFNFFLSSSF